VIRDGVAIYSKRETGRFPEHDEILSVVLRGE
jgi:hypothetical protein